MTTADLEILRFYRKKGKENRNYYAMLVRCIYLDYMSDVQG